MKTIRDNAFWIVVAGVALYFIGRYLYAQPRFVNGEVAPDFTLTTIEGKAFQLSQLRGQYVLLDFWGSWCAPCIEETPQLKTLHQAFAGKTFKDASGFSIVGVGIERDSVRWASTIQALGLSGWTHISDFQYLSSLPAQLYGVRVVPTKFLVNPQGIIIGVNQPIESIESYLSGRVANR